MNLNYSAQKITIDEKSFLFLATKQNKMYHLSVFFFFLVSSFKIILFEVSSNVEMDIYFDKDSRLNLSYM